MNSKQRFWSIFLILSSVEQDCLQKCQPTSFPVVSMGCGCQSGRVIKNELTLENYIYYDGKCDQCVFSECRNIKPRSLNINAKQKSCNWQVGFFDADGEVYFDQIVLGYYTSFSSIVRNYWWSGKEGEGKKEGYYSLIKSVRKLKIKEEHVNDLLDYVEGRYEVGEHWQRHELDRSMEIEIWPRAEGTTVERLSKYFNDIQCDKITTELRAVNNITCCCEYYCFKNCEGVVPQKLVINAAVRRMRFQNAVNEVHIPEVVMEEKADFFNVVQNRYGKCGEEKYYSLLPYIQTLIIKNNAKVLCDLADYINGRYKIDDGWVLYQLNKNMKIVIEKSGIAFGIVKEISDYFTDVLVDSNKPEQYLAKQQPYQESFQEHFAKYALETNQIGSLILTSQELRLKDGKFNVGCSSSSIKINLLSINQKKMPQQFICFHDTDKPVITNKIIITKNGDLRCVLQNAYYNGTDSGFFSLLWTAKELGIYHNKNEDNQVLVDLADYIEGKYALNTNWKWEELDKDMRINIYNGKYSLSLSVAQRLRNYFRNVFIDRIWTQLQTQNIIDQSCEDKYMFYGSREANPQKLTINAKLMGGGILIAFKQANGKVHVPEITIDEQGCFAAIVRNWWQNNKKSGRKKYGCYSLVQHVETLTIRNNLVALGDLTNYMVGKYEIKSDDWELKQLNKDIKVVVEGPIDYFLPILRIYNYFNEVTINRKQPENYLAIWELWNDSSYRALKTCFGVHGLIVEPRQYGIEAKKNLQLIDYVYNIRKSMGSIESLTVRQKLNINQFICFHDINKTVTVNKIVIDGAGDLRNVLQNAYYKKGKAGFFNLLKTAKNLEIRNNKQAVENLADYVDGKYALHPKWETKVLDKDMVIKIYHDKHAFSLDITIRFRNYFKNVSIDAISTLLETENVINQECKDKYVFGSCRDTNPQKLVVNAKLEYYKDLIKFYDADGEVCIPEITIGERGSFDAIVRNQWRNCKNDNEEKDGYYSLLSHVKTLIIQNNPKAVCDLDSYVSGNYKIKDDDLKVQKLNENITIRINGVNGLDEQIDRLKDYFGYIVIDDRKVLGNQRREAIMNIQLDSDKIQQQSTANDNKRKTIAYVCTDIEEIKRRIEQARDRLRRRRVRFQEYLALTE